MTDQPHENTLTVDELRREVRLLWDREHALNDALQVLPEVPSVLVLQLLSSAAMNIRWPDLWVAGKTLQLTHGLGVVPPKTEYEAAAGLWSLLRQGLQPELSRPR